MLLLLRNLSDLINVSVAFDMDWPELHDCVHEGLGAALVRASHRVILQHHALLLHVTEKDENNYQISLNTNNFRINFKTKENPKPLTIWILESETQTRK
jgi:hypothetical protein